MCSFLISPSRIAWTNSEVTEGSVLLFFVLRTSAMLECARKLLDTADIVREAFFNNNPFETMQLHGFH